LGLFDSFVSSYNAETELTRTDFRMRQYGRLGMGLMVVGVYLIFLGMRIFIRPAISDFEKRLESDAHRLAKLMKQEADELDLMTVFTMRIWKRSALALCLLLHSFVALSVLEFAASEIFRDNIFYMLVGLYLLKVAMSLVVHQFMKEMLLVVPINVIAILTNTLAILAAPDLFSFLMCFLIQLLIQTFDRIYVSPSQEYILYTIEHRGRKAWRMLQWLARGAKPWERQRFVPEEGASEYEDEDLDTLDEKFKQEARNRPVRDPIPSDMIGCMASYSTDLLAALWIPVVLGLCWFFYDETDILLQFDITPATAPYYMTFFVIIFFFHILFDILCLNIMELFHRWRIMDYLRYCKFRFDTRADRWKGEGKSVDEGVPPSVRSLDLLCFSEQYYFMVSLLAAGTFTWLLGMQVLFSENWNMFDDPAFSVVFPVVWLVCGFIKTCSVWTANYLRVWKVPSVDVAKRVREGEEKSLLEEWKEIKAKPILRAPPGGGIMEGWVEPEEARDPYGLARYKQEFVKENAIWLQQNFREVVLGSRQTMERYRTPLLKALATLMGTLDPRQLQALGAVSPEEQRDTQASLAISPREDESVTTAPAEGALFGFNVPPDEQMAELLRRRKETGRVMHVPQVCADITRMWRQRAKFLLHLQRQLRVVKPNSALALANQRQCELCGNPQAIDTYPIYSAMAMASQFRQTRDLSPLWNETLWLHYYKTFTPTAVLCATCYQTYHSRNRNIPLERGVGQPYTPIRLALPSARPAQDTAPFPDVTVPPHAATIMRAWLQAARTTARGGGEEASEAEEGEGKPAEEAAASSEHMEEAQVGDVDEWQTPRPFEGVDVALSAPSRRLMRLWLQKARTSLGRGAPT